VEWLFEVLFQIFGELILQFIFEALAQAGLHFFKRPNRESANPALSFVGYAIFGAFAGWLSTLLFPHYLLRTHHARLLYLFVAPAAVGAGIAAIGSWRARRGQSGVGIDRFIFGYVFAFLFALVRFFLAKQASS
jgi:hypothetical protein